MQTHIRNTRPDVKSVAVIFGFVFFSAWIGVLFTGGEERIASLWLANAGALAMLLESSRSRWNGILLATLLANLVANMLAGDPFSTALLLALANVVEVVLALWLTIVLIGPSIDLKRLDHLIRFLAICALPAPLISAILAAAIISAVHPVSFLAAGQRWYLADALGLVALTPLLLAVNQESLRTLLVRPRLGEALAIMSLLMIVLAGVFSQKPNPLLFLIFPVICLAAFRTGFLGACVAIGIVAATSAIFTIAGFGPIASHFPQMADRIIFLQIFVASCLLTALPIASVLADREQLTSGLRESERRFRRLAETAPIGIFLTNSYHEISFTNRRWCDFAGGEPVQWLGQDWRAILTPGVRTEIEGMLDAVALAGTTYEADLAIPSDRGETRWVRATLAPKREMDRTIIGWIGTLLDITDLRASEQQLAASERTHRLLAENATDIIARLDVRGNIHFVSAASERLLGYDSNGLTGRNYLDLVVDDDRSALIEMLGQAGRGHEGGTCVHLARRKDGSTLWLEGAFRAICSPGADEVEIVATIRDVSERQAAEAAMHRTLAQLSESIRLLSMAEHLAGVGHWRRDLKSGTINWSDEVYRIYGHEIGDPISSSGGIERFHPDDREFVETAIQHSIDVGDPLYFRARILRPSGELRFVQSQGQAERSPDGGISGLFGVFQDITDQIRAEAALLDEKERAEAAAEAKSEFLAIMSHEIRTPMTGIIAMLEILAEDEGKGPDSRKAIASIQQSARTLMTVLDDVLDHSKIEQGKLTLEAIDFDLALLIGGTADLFRASANAKHVEILSTVERAMPVSGDPVRTQQILSNFISNAVKFTASGTIQIAGRQIGADFYRLEVRDSGIGIEKEALDGLFQPFTQGDRSTTRRFGGSGLGLSIARRLAQAMGGDVGAESAPGVGSLFWADIRLPPASGPVERNASEPSGLADRIEGVPHILVVDDTDTTRIAAEAHLTALGCHAEGASDGLSALSMICREEFDLVLMDSAMPGIDGATTITLLRQLPGANRDVPVIGFTAFSQPEQQARLRDAGAQTILVKPFTRRSLAEAIMRHLQPQRRLSLTGSVDQVQEPAILAMPAAFRERVLESLRRDLLRLKAEVRASLEDGDWEAAGRALHALKGMSGNFEFGELSGLCAFAEALLSAIAPRPLPWLADSLEARAEDALVVIDRLQANSSTVD